ncbi:MAG: NAD-dependent malic enzyme [Ignavibacteria bacterium]|nr:NAD-dependent malic enzyme [Ignavibacteria bacterium]
MANGHPSGKRGMDLLRDPRWNHGTAFTRDERVEYGLLGLLPDIVSTMQMQERRIKAHIDSLPTDLDKYIYFNDLQDRNESCYYSILMKDPVKYMPIVYTPTVGLACQTFGRIYRRPKGLYISLKHRGYMSEVMRNWPEADVRFICVTDGERILGLGDLGAQGMGIPIGKLALYTAVAGVPPYFTLPIVLDVGTNNKELRNDPFYIGVPQERLVDEEYDAFIEEFVQSVEEVFPGCCIQWEDFANQNAGIILERYRNRIPSFNDDIQGTAATGVAGIIAAMKYKSERLQDQTFLFFGAGSAGLGIANLLCTAMLKDGITVEEARSRCWLVDSKGLVVKQRNDLSEGKADFAHDHRGIPTLLESVRELKATVIIGTSTIPNSFSRDVIEQMASNAERPIIMAFSNPTSKSECSAQDAYLWSEGRAIFASGSPFPPFEYQGKTIFPGQGNNIYIFPAVGLAILATKPKTIPDKVFSRAARALASLVTQEQFDRGQVYPPLEKIRESTHHVAVAVTEYFFEAGLATVAKPDSVEEYVASMSWKPEY